MSIESRKINSFGLWHCFEKCLTFQASSLSFYRLMQFYTNPIVHTLYNGQCTNKNESLGTHSFKLYFRIPVYELLFFASVEVIIKSGRIKTGCYISVHIPSAPYSPNANYYSFPASAHFSELQAQILLIFTSK